jgi:hypothetical protein
LNTQRGRVQFANHQRDHLAQRRRYLERTWRSNASEDSSGGRRVLHVHHGRTASSAAGHPACQTGGGATTAARW